jgi:uncharacterized protein (TIGR00106 family)
MEGEKTLIEFSITPIGNSEHVSDQVARCTRLVRESGIRNELHAMGTILEGDLDGSLDVIKRCLRDVLRDSPRAAASIRIDARSNGENSIEASVRSVEEKV